MICFTFFYRLAKSHKFSKWRHHMPQYNSYVQVPWMQLAGKRTAFWNAPLSVSMPAVSVLCHIKISLSLSETLRKVKKQHFKVRRYSFRGMSEAPRGGFRRKTNAPRGGFRGTTKTPRDGFREMTEVPSGAFRETLRCLRVASD